MSEARQQRSERIPIGCHFGSLTLVRAGAGRSRLKLPRLESHGRYPRGQFIMVSRLDSAMEYASIIKVAAMPPRGSADEPDGMAYLMPHAASICPLLLSAP